LQNKYLNIKNENNASLEKDATVEKRLWKKTNPLRRVSEVRDRMFMCKGAN